MTLNSLGFNKFKEEEPFQKTYFETQLSYENIKTFCYCYNVFTITKVSIL